MISYFKAISLNEAFIQLLQLIIFLRSLFIIFVVLVFLKMMPLLPLDRLDEAPISFFFHTIESKVVIFFYLFKVTFAHMPCLFSFFILRAFRIRLTDA